MGSELLVVSEKMRLSELETIIQKGTKTFFEVGMALYEIRESKLYRETYHTFEEYCRIRWDLSREYAYKQIAAGKVVKNLCTMGDILPVNERQARELVDLEPEQQKQVWEEVLAAGKEGINAALIRDIREGLFGEPSNYGENEEETEANERKEITDDKLLLSMRTTHKLIKQAKERGWENAPRLTVVHRLDRMMRIAITE